MDWEHERESPESARAERLGLAHEGAQLVDDINKRFEGFERLLPLLQRRSQGVFGKSKVGLDGTAKVRNPAVADVDGERTRALFALSSDDLAFACPGATVAARIAATWGDLPFVFRNAGVLEVVAHVVERYAVVALQPIQVVVKAVGQNSE